MAISIQEMARRMSNTREFCGNELEAAKEFFFENGEDFDIELYLEALMKVDEEWEQLRLEAKKD